MDKQTSLPLPPFLFSWFFYCGCLRDWAWRGGGGVIINWFEVSLGWNHYYFFLKVQVSAGIVNAAALDRAGAETLLPVSPISCLLSVVSQHGRVGKGTNSLVLSGIILSWSTKLTLRMLSGDLFEPGTFNGYFKCLLCVAVQLRNPTRAVCGCQQALRLGLGESSGSAPVCVSVEETRLEVGNPHLSQHCRDMNEGPMLGKNLSIF